MGPFKFFSSFLASLHARGMSVREHEMLSVAFTLPFKTVLTITYGVGSGITIIIRFDYQDLPGRNKSDI